MEESLCNVEFLKGPKAFIARVQSDLGGMREYRSESFEEVLEQIIIDLQEEFETSSVQVRNIFDSVRIYILINHAHNVSL